MHDMVIRVTARIGEDAEDHLVASVAPLARQPK